MLTEIVFNRPGLGKLILGALNPRDYTLLQGLMIVFAICIIVVNTLTDLAYGFVDPRVKYSDAPPLSTAVARPAACGSRFRRNRLSWVGLVLLAADRARRDLRAAASRPTIRSSRTSPTGSSRRRPSSCSAPTPTAATCSRA